MRYTGPTAAQLLGQGEIDLKRCSIPSATSTISVDDSSSHEGMLISPSSSSAASSLAPTSSPSSAATSSAALKASPELEYLKIKDAINNHYDADDGIREWGWPPTVVRQKFHDQIVNLIHLGGFMGMTATEVHDIMEQVMIEEFWSMRRNESDEDETVKEESEEDEIDVEEGEEDEIDEQESEEDAESEV
jgi:hypothetical protein